MKTVLLFITVCSLSLSSSGAIRIWRTVDGDVYEGSLEKILFEKAYIRDSKGKILQIPVEKLSPEDSAFIYRDVVPEIRIDVRKKDREQKVLPWGVEDDITILYTLDIRLIKTSEEPYNSNLSAEVFMLGEEVDGDNYVLVNRTQVPFVFPPGKKSEFSFEVKDIQMRRYYEQWADVSAIWRGITYLGYLVVVMDAEGNILAAADTLGSLRWLTEDIPASVKHLRRIAFQGRGSVFSRHFDESFRKRSVPRLQFFEPDYQY